MFTEADGRDLYFVRTPLELGVLRCIVENDLPLDSAELSLRALEALPHDASWGDRLEARTGFHIVLINAAGNARLLRLYLAMQEEKQLCLAQLYASYPGPRDLAREDRLLLEAIQSDARAQAEMRAHLEHPLHDLTKNGAEAD